MTDIATLFATDPLQLSRDNIDQIIKEMRTNRHLFNTTGTAPSTKTPAKSKEVLSLSQKFSL